MKYLAQNSYLAFAKIIRKNRKTWAKTGTHFLSSSSSSSLKKLKDFAP
jgi:hypothetical protein